MTEKIFTSTSEGFTLAEVLITLGIIGVVAAVTIPNLIQKNFERRVISTLKETQSILAQAFRLSQEEYGEVEGWGLVQYSGESASLIANNLRPFMKISLDCGLNDTNRRCVQGTYLMLNGEKYNIDYATASNYYKIALLNGSSIWWRAAQENDALIYFWIDINGKQLPNTFGKDLFMFSYANGNVVPNGSPFSSHDARQHCIKGKSTGWGCAYYVIMQGNMNYLH